MKESALRDLIAQKISQLKPGLTLLQKEQYIPGEHGTKVSPTKALCVCQTSWLKARRYTRFIFSTRST